MHKRERTHLLTQLREGYDPEAFERTYFGWGGYSDEALEVLAECMKADQEITLSPFEGNA